MASAMVRSLLVCRASCIVRASGAFLYNSSSGARNCCFRDVEYGRRWSLTRVIGREFSRQRRIGRAPLPIAPSSGRAEAVVEQMEDESEEEEKLSRNASKKQSARAREWGRELATLSPAQLRQACKWASLDEDVYDAVMLVKNLGTSSKVKHGRRRQYNYIGGLLRNIDPEIMESVLKATKDGDVEGLVFIPSNEPEDMDVGFGGKREDEEAEEEDHGALQEAESWLQGLVAGVRAVEDEVYSMYDVDFDRQELRKLVREARKHESESLASASDADEAEGGQELSEAEISYRQSKRENAQKSLLQFLLEVIKERRDNAYDSAVR